MALLATACCSSQDTASGDPRSGVLDGDAVIESAADVARVGIYARVTGDLVLRHAGGETGLELGLLERVDGSIRLEELTLPRAGWTLSLPALKRVGLNLAFADIEGEAGVELPVLEFVGGHLELLRGTYRLSAPSLTALNGRLTVQDCRVHLAELTALVTIGGDLSLKRFSRLDPDRTATVVFSLPALTAVAGDLELRQAEATRFEAPSLTDLAGALRMTGLAAQVDLSALRGVGDDISIRNARLPELKLDALVELGGGLQLLDVTFEPAGPITLHRLATVADAIDIQRVEGVAELRLPVLSSVGSWIRIRDNSRLTSIDLPLLVRTESDLILSKNGPLAVTLPLLKQVGGNLELDRNNQLNASFSALTTVVGNVQIESTTLAALDFPALTIVQRNLRLADLTWRTPAAELPLLREVHGTLGVTDSLFLERISLPDLQSIGSSPGGIAIGGLIVERNPQLTALSAPSLATVAVDLVVRDNPRLDVAALKAQLDGAQGGGTQVGGTQVGGDQVVCNNGEGAPCP